MSAQPDDPLREGEAPAEPNLANALQSPSIFSKTRWIAPVLIVALASHGYVYFRFHYAISNDAREYLELGLSLAHHGELMLPSGDYARRMPLYPAFIAAIQRWQGDRDLLHAVVEMQSLLSFVSTILIALIARRLSDPRGGIVAGLVAALYSPYRYLQAVYLSETLAMALLIAALFLYVLSLQPRRTSAPWPLLGAVSILLGLALLTRADAAVLVVPFAIHAMARAGPPRVRMVRAAVLLIGVTLAAAFWGQRNQRILGEWTLSTTGGLNFYLGNNPEYARHPGMDHADYGVFNRLRREGIAEFEADRRLYAMGRAFVADHLGEAFVNIFRKTRVWFGSSVTWSAPGTPLIIFWTLALAARTTRHRRTLSILAVLMSIVWLAVLLRIQRPWTNPALVVPLGLLGLFTFHDRLCVRWLLVGLIAAQLAVAIVYIPLERLRWTVDGILIIALGVAVARLGRYLESQQKTPSPQ
jgi:dolichyl-phosphate-mannose-protein mannosyltransferase